MRQEALLKDPLGEGFQDAIRLFRGLGSAAAPVARELQQQNRANVTRRLQSLALAVLTEEEPEDLVGLLKGASVEERMMAFLVLAGLEEDGTEILLPLLQGKDRVLPLRLTVAALAAATHGTPVDRAVDAYRDDPGVVAAGQLSGSAVDCDLRPWLADEPRRRPHSDLVLRGAFLGHIEPGKQVPDLVLGAARKAFESPATVDAVREAAALLLGAKGWIPAPPGSTPPPPALLWHCAGAADEERMALLREWLGSKPSALYEYPGRLAVCHALSRLVPDAKDTRSTWIRTVGADDIALTFALRVLWWDEDPAQVIDVGCVEAGGLVDLARITDTVDHPACLSWLAWAAGATASPRSDSGNPRLDAAAALAAEGRLPRTVAARILEDALWTRGNHPRLAVREARLQLVRDLLLSGSNPGLRYASAVPLHERYVVRDLPRDAPWFEVAVEVWDALSPPGLPMPARHRLR